MKFTGTEIDDKGRAVLITTTDRLFRKPLTRKFVAVPRGLGMFFFRELPDHIIATDSEHFQLQAWMEEYATEL